MANPGVSASSNTPKKAAEINAAAFTKPSDNATPLAELRAQSGPVTIQAAPNNANIYPNAPRPGTRPVWPPNAAPGSAPEYHTPENCSDLVRHLGYKYTSPAVPVAPGATGASGASGPVVVGNGAPPQAPGVTLDGAMDALGALRKAASDVGVRWDPSWGINRLSQEIAAVKAADPALSAAEQAQAASVLKANQPEAPASQAATSVGASRAAPKVDMSANK